MRWRVAAVLLGIALLGTITLGAVLRASDNRTQTRNTRISSCESLNQYRLEDLHKWQFILSLAPAPPSGPESDMLHRFVKYLDESDAPKPCN